MPTQERIDELTKTYAAGKATDEDIHELFAALGESEAEIQHRIDIERGTEDPNIVV